MTLRIDPKHTVLLLGAGFSIGCTNIVGKPIPMGAGLRKIIVDELQRKDEGAGYDELDLKAAAEALYDVDPNKFTALLGNYFSINSYTEHHEFIAKHDWMRIYTTNYDNLLEIILESNVPVYSTIDSRPEKVAFGSVIHLHGGIFKKKNMDLMSALVLGERAYVEQRLEQSTWYQLLQSDFDVAENVLIIGYSVSDPSIANILADSNNSREKTYFINGHDLKTAHQSRLEKYGRVFKIDIGSIREIINFESTTEIKKFKSFVDIRDLSKSAELVDPTVYEIKHFLGSGDLDKFRFFMFRDLDMISVPMNTELSQVIDCIKREQNVIVRGRIGNGKSMFLMQAAVKLSRLGYSVYYFHKYMSSVFSEIKNISLIKNSVIVIDELINNKDLIRKIRNACQDVPIITAERSGLLNDRLSLVQELFGNNVYLLNIGTINRKQVQILNGILRSAGLREIKFTNRNNSADLRDAIVTMFKENDIVNRVFKQLSDLNDQNLIRSVLTSLVFPYIGIAVTEYTLRYYNQYKNVMYKIQSNRGLTSDFLDVTDDKITIKSAIFSEQMLQRCFDPRVSIEVMVQIGTVAARNQSDGLGRRVFSNITRFSHLIDLYGASNIDNIREHFYEKLRNINEANLHPLFWLQYSMLEKQARNLDNSIYLLGVAYMRAESMAYFETYQLDTHALSVYCKYAQTCKGEKFFEAIDFVFTYTEKNIELLQKKEHVQFAIKSLLELIDVERSSSKLFDLSIKAKLVFYLNKIHKELSFMQKNNSFSMINKFKQNISDINACIERLKLSDKL